MVEGKEEKRIRKNDKYIYIMYIICIYIRTHNVKIIKNEREKEEKEETINHAYVRSSRTGKNETRERRGRKNVIEKEEQKKEIQKER